MVDKHESTSLPTTPTSGDCLPPAAITPTPDPEESTTVSDDLVLSIEDTHRVFDDAVAFLTALTVPMTVDVTATNTITTKLDGDEYSSVEVTPSDMAAPLECPVRQGRTAAKPADPGGGDAIPPLLTPLLASFDNKV